MVNLKTCDLDRGRQRTIKIHLRGFAFLQRLVAARFHYINTAGNGTGLMHKAQVAGVLMIVVGAVILLLLASFVVSLIVTILELFVVIIGIILVLGGIAAILFGRRWWKRTPWGWDEHPAST